MIESIYYNSEVLQQLKVSFKDWLLIYFPFKDDDLGSVASAFGVVCNLCATFICSWPLIFFTSAISGHCEHHHQNTK